jgi:hypothetical protein
VVNDLGHALAQQRQVLDVLIDPIVGESLVAGSVRLDCKKMGSVGGTLWRFIDNLRVVNIVISSIPAASPNIPFVINALQTTKLIIL